MIENQKRRRLSPGDRKAEITAAALLYCESNGFMALTQKAAHSAAGCSFGLVTKHFKSMAGLKSEVMHLAVKNKSVSVIACGMALSMPEVATAPQDLKRKAAAWLNRAPKK